MCQCYVILGLMRARFVELGGERGARSRAEDEGVRPLRVEGTRRIRAYGAGGRGETSSRRKKAKPCGSDSRGKEVGLRGDEGYRLIRNNKQVRVYLAPHRVLPQALPAHANIRMFPPTHVIEAHSATQTDIKDLGERGQQQRHAHRLRLSTDER
jgi:hypothetical protein